METMKNGVKVGNSHTYCMGGFWWCHNTDIFMYLISGKGLHANSVQCIVCIKWIHKRCSGIRGELSLLVNGFRCMRCEGTIQEADLAGNLVVDGETCGCVQSFS